MPALLPPIAAPSKMLVRNNVSMDMSTHEALNCASLANLYDCADERRPDLQRSSCVWAPRATVVATNHPDISILKDTIMASRTSTSKPSLAPAASGVDVVDQKDAVSGGDSVNRGTASSLKHKKRGKKT